MQLPSIIQSFFFPKAPPSPLKKPIYQQTERIINIAYLVLLSLSVVGIISGVFLSLSFPPIRRRHLFNLFSRRFLPTCFVSIAPGY